MNALLDWWLEKNKNPETAEVEIEVQQEPDTETEVPIDTEETPVENGHFCEAKIGALIGLLKELLNSGKEEDFVLAKAVVEKLDNIFNG